jgi:hypothetical protein
MDLYHGARLPPSLSPATGEAKRGGWGEAEIWIYGREEELWPVERGNETTVGPCLPLDFISNINRLMS